MTVPAATPVTIPDVLPTVAVAMLLLLHVPPVVVFVRVEVPPTHTDAVPKFDAGSGFTVMFVTLRQPVGNV